MPKASACGFVLYHRQGEGTLYLTLRNALHGDIGLPKGHAEPGEDPLETALRECEEETGIRREFLAVRRHFRRRIRYPAGGGEKEVTYFLAETPRIRIHLSEEHSAFLWSGLGETVSAIRHENLRGIVRDAATWLKDPALRGGLSPAQARALLERHAGPEAPVLAHTTEVAGMARKMAEAWGGLDADFVEAAAWVHDVGRARTHGSRHPLEGFRLLVEGGHPGYAPSCLSHFTKGATYEQLAGDDRADPDLVREMFEACDLDTFPVEERLISLADSLAVGARRGTLEERRRDLERRYGPSTLITRNYEISRRLLAEVEARIGLPLYPLLRIPAAGA